MRDVCAIAKSLPPPDILEGWHGHVKIRENLEFKKSLELLKGKHGISTKS